MKSPGKVLRLARRVGVIGAVGALIVAGVGAAGPRTIDTPYVVFSYNDLGMHCMQDDFSQFLILPPYNTVHAQVIRRGHSPDIETSDLTVTYSFIGNTRSADKTNFWTYDQALLGVDLPTDVGLTGSGMSGTMSPTPSRDFVVTGIPITPIDDDGRENPYPLATVTAKMNNNIVAQTQPVVPVSWEINCALCHNTPGESPATDILRAHDRLHDTNLEASQPVFCAGCHADPALGAPGQPGVSTFSAAMHSSHADRMNNIELDESCYACHPGVRTQCQRDLHFAAGITCTQCHGDMAAVGDPARTPWVDEPRCSDCHNRPGFEYEEPGKLFRDSRGHKNVMCYACHGSPHAMTPTVTEADNLQAMNIQGHAGVINTCTVCHITQPEEAFFHRRHDD